MLNMCLVIILIFISLIVFRLITSQKNTLHKILFLNTLTGLIVLFICILGTYKSNNFYIDIAIIYSILSFIGTCGYLRFFIETKESDPNIIDSAHE